MVGAGPVGLTAALALVRGGLTVDLIESRQALGSESLAATFHPPTLQILSDLGIDLGGHGLAARTIAYRRGGGRIALRLPLAELAGETGHPYRRHLPQLQVCRMILDRLLQSPACRVRFGERATAQTASGYRWVFAADGAGSALREDAGIDFPGTDYAGSVVRLICDPIGFEDWDPVTYVLAPGESVSVLRMADHVRVIVRVDEHDEDPAGTAVRVCARTTGVDPVVLVWSSYRSQRRVIAANVAGNLIFVGDSAHVTTTRGGMNMNAGIHDAAVIAAAIARDPSSLTEVAERRLTVARDILLPRTHETLEDPSGRLSRILALADDPVARRDFLRRGAMLDMVSWP